MEYFWETIETCVPPRVILGALQEAGFQSVERRVRMGILSEHDGMWQCTFVGECTKACPKHVDPAGAIQQYKLAGVGH